MKKPRQKKMFASLILTTGYDQEEALKRLVLGILGFGTILGNKIQTSEYDPDSETQGLMLPTRPMLNGWLAEDMLNREMVDLDLVESVVNETIEGLKVQAEKIQKDGAEKINKSVN